MKIQLSILGISLLISMTLMEVNVSAKTPNQLIADRETNNVDDLPNDPGQMMTWTCENSEDSILVEAKDNKIWSSIIEQQNWNCQENLSDVPTGSLKFTCEPTEDGIIDLLTVTWLSGKDEKRQMGQWIHQLADEYNMSCSMAKVGLFDNIE